MIRQLPIRGLLPALFVAICAGGPAPAQSETAPDTLRETFRDWTVHCTQQQEGPRVCEMFQRLDHEESGRNILVFSVRRNAQDELAAVMITPFGLRLSQGVQLLAGEEPVGRYDFETCLSRGCLVAAPLAEETITAMRQAADGQVRVVTRSGEDFNIPVSFWGFSAALDRLNELGGA